MIAYDVKCVHCVVDHLDVDGVMRSDTVSNGFLLRFLRDVGESLELKSTSIVNDSSMVAQILVDYSVHSQGTGTGIIPTVTLKEEVPSR